MRRILTLAIFLVLVALTGCGETPQPTLPTAPPPTATIAPTQLPTDTVQAPPTSTTVEVEPTTLPTSTALKAEPTALPTSAAPTPTPILDTELPWPTFLRELDFGIPAGNGYNPRALAAHPGLGRLYARTTTRTSGVGEMGLVTVMDLTSGQVLAVVETGPDSYSEGELIVDPILNRVYAVNPDDSTCSVLDAETLEPVATLDGVQHLALDAEGGRLYVAGPPGRRLLDATTYETLLETSLPPGWEILALDVDPSADRLYLAARDSSGYVLSLYEAATLEALSTVLLPGYPDALLAAPGWQRLFVTLDDGEESLLWIMDDRGRLMGEYPLGKWTQETRLALDSEGERLFLGRDVYDNYGITVLDLNTGQEVADIPLTHPLKSLIWDGGSGRLLFSDTYTERIYVVDLDAGQVRGFFPTALELIDLAVDPGRGHLYVTDTAGQLRVLDSDTDEQLAILPGEGRIELDSPHGRLYTGGEGADRVRIFDTDTLRQTGEIRTSARPVADAYQGGLYLVNYGIYLTSLETMTITGVISDTLPQNPGYSPNPAAIDAVVDPGSGRILAIINNGVPGSNNGNYLYVYEPETYRQVFSDTERSPIFLDLDPATGRAYVSRIHMSLRSTSLLQDGREYTARLDSVFGALRVDPALRSVYLSIWREAQDRMLILDAEKLDVLGTVPISGTLLALDAQRHLLYLGTGHGQVEIWSARGGELPPAAAPVPADLDAEEIYQIFPSPGDGPLFALDKDYHLYRSDDGGDSWKRIRGGLPDEWVLDLVFSPDFAQDQTLFAALATADQGYGVWKSTDGGWSWSITSRGLTDLAVTNLLVSPTFVRDRTLFAVARKGGLYRSADAGQSWTPLTERYRPPDAYTQEPGPVVFSPTYAQDQTLFVSHYGLQRSSDGGETWTRVFAHTIRTLTFSPDYAADRTLFGWTSQGGLLRSTDGGASWMAAGAGLTISRYGSERLLVSPDFSTSQTLYLIWTPGMPDTPGLFFRSTDAATTWERLAGEPPQAATPIELTEDGTAFVAKDDAGQEVRWPVADLAWQAGIVSVADIAVDRLIPSPHFAQDGVLFAQSGGAGILRSDDALQDASAGLTWTDTGFPIRVTYGDLPELVVAPPDTLLAATELGLYRSTDGGPWTQMGGGLPLGVGTGKPSLGTDGSLRLLAGRGKAFLSTDGGLTWTQPIPDLPYPVNEESLLFSPAFATDHTAFLGAEWRKPQRTVNGGPWEVFGPTGEWVLSGLQLSPAFDRDGLVFMRLDDRSLWRSTDGGDTWTDVSGPWGDEAPLDPTLEPGYIGSAVAFSPEYARDGVLLTRAGDAIYRSTDRGTTWARVLDLEPPPARIIFMPNYASEGVIYLLQGRTLYRSIDRGRVWEALPLAPWAENDYFRVQPSPTFARDRTLLAWSPFGSVYHSSDGGASWHDANGGLPEEGVRQILFSPHYATDGLAYLVPAEQGLYKRVGEGPWVPADESAPLPTPLPTSTPQPRPMPTPTSVSCATEPIRFRAVWQQVRVRLGCPAQPASQVDMAEQAFEQGNMIWDSSNQQIYVLLLEGTWQAFDDTWTSDQPASDATLVPPEGRVQPQRGFGKVWREQLGGPQAAIGWALEDERPVAGWRQRFENGLLVWTDARAAGREDPGTAYLLYDDGTWQAVPTPVP